MSTVDKLMALADEAGRAAEDLRSIERYIATVEDDDWAQEQLKKNSAINYAAREALRAAIVEALDLGEPVAWHVLDEKGQLMHAASWLEAAHEHINDAINECDITEAKAWKVIPVVYAPKDKP